MMSLVGCSEPEMANVLRGLGYRVHPPSEENGPLHAFSIKPRFVREREEQRERQRLQQRQRTRPAPPRPAGAAATSVSSSPIHHVRRAARTTVRAADHGPEAARVRCASADGPRADGPRADGPRNDGPRPQGRASAAGESRARRPAWPASAAPRQWRPGACASTPRPRRRATRRPIRRSPSCSS